MKDQYKEQITVLIGGSVANGGLVVLPNGAKIRDALAAAGGSRGQGWAKPGRLITLSRPAGWDDDPDRQVFQWNLEVDSSGECWGFRLEDRDALVFSFDFDEDEEDEK